MTPYSDLALAFFAGAVFACVIGALAFAVKVAPRRRQMPSRFLMPRYDNALWQWTGGEKPENAEAK